MKKHISSLVVLIILIAIAWVAAVMRDSGQERSQTRTPIATALYICDGGRTISADYYEGAKAPAPEAGEPPLPTGSVDVSLDGGATTTLMQTISASGIRYANDDESFVFWSKGEKALIMRDNRMDLGYTNCAARGDL